ncbi:hypothetical protein P4O66_023077 [Electrophorus voltai]|uniref:Uncharacterized protein n=1 Tax=Electrophorus voltai TaxID=2609070 RepID=A0AAD9E3Z3_9TELE|nr:hypothetical protein P4O66_023077 [Electrophorus voltai]
MHSNKCHVAEIIVALGTQQQKTIARVPSGRQKTSSSMEAGAQDVQQQEKVLSDLSVNVVGQRVAYCNGPAEKAMSPPQSRPAGREPLRALRPVKGVFAFTGAPCYPGVTLSPEQEELVRKSPREPLIGVYGHAVSAGHMDSEESTEPEKAARNGSVLASTKAELLDDLPSSPNSTHATQKPGQRFESPHSSQPSHGSFQTHAATTPTSPQSEQSMSTPFKLLWEKKIDGLILMRSLARYHSDVLSSRLHDVCLVLNQEVQNLRSGVSRVALVTLGELYSGLQKGMDQEWKLLPRSSSTKQESPMLL